LRSAQTQREPDWTLLPANVPPRVRELLRLCLQKDIRKRRSDAADVRIDIEQALAEPAAATPATPPARGARLAWIASFAVAAVLIVALAVPAGRHLRETLLLWMPVQPTGEVPPAASDGVMFDRPHLARAEASAPLKAAA